jgi:hypothetical protein
MGKAPTEIGSQGVSSLVPIFGILHTLTHVQGCQGSQKEVGVLPQQADRSHSLKAQQD